MFQVVIAMAMPGRSGHREDWAGKIFIGFLEMRSGPGESHLLLEPCISAIELQVKAEVNSGL